LTDAPATKLKKLKTSRGVVNPALAGLDATPFSPSRHPRVRAAMRRVTGDRSLDTMRVVGACYDSGLTLANVRWAIQQRQDLAERLEDRRDDDVARCWERATQSREHKNEAKEFLG
jgi:putative DNA primase/helicase